MALAADVTRRIRKQYIGYFRGKKSFFTVELQKQRVLIYLSLTADTAQPWNPDTMRDTKSIGHFGMGDVEYSLTSTDQLDEVTALLKVAYETSSLARQRAGSGYRVARRVTGKDAPPAPRSDGAEPAGRPMRTIALVRTRFVRPTIGMATTRTRGDGGRGRG